MTQNGNPVGEGCVLLIIWFLLASTASAVLTPCVGLPLTVVFFVFFRHRVRRIVRDIINNDKQATA